MKTNIMTTVAALCVSAMMLTSCGTMGQVGATGTSSASTTTTSNSTSSTAGSILGSILDGLIGNAVPVTEQSIVGTWVYQSPEVRFESEGLLNQAGGEIAAATIEKKLEELYTKVGIVAGTSKFVFNEDKSCSIVIGKKSINGTYTIDTANNSINITSTTGLMKLNGKVYFGLNSLVILFDANKVLTMAQTIGTLTGQGSSTIGTLASALNNYKGLLLGMNLKK